MYRSREPCYLCSDADPPAFLVIFTRRHESGLGEVGLQHFPHLGREDRVGHLGNTGLKAMQERGRMQEGMVADITIFDPETTTDTSTCRQGTLLLTGIPYVVVSGTIVVRDSRVLKGLNPGLPIRFEPRSKGRFESITEENWEKTYYVFPIDFGGGLQETQPRKIGRSETQPHMT